MRNRLRVFRAEWKWSQRELAERLGISRQAINAIETEKHDPSLDVAFRIARLFHSSIEQIFQPETERAAQHKSRATHSNTTDVTDPN